MIRYVVIFSTCANKREAQKISRGLIREKLAACVNIIEKIESIFWWKGKTDSAKEALLIIKSKYSSLNKIIKVVKSLHSYEVPEIIALPITGGYKPYLEWMDESVK